MAGALLVLVALLGPALVRPAQAYEGGWIWIEYRLPVVGPGHAFPRTSLRLFTDVRTDTAAEGLRQSFLRVGPLVDVTSWLFVGLHGVLYADRVGDGRFAQEARLELEPNLHGRLGPITFNDRNRLEYRWRDTGDSWRYRNQLRFAYQPIGALWVPFVWNEVLIDLSGQGFNQNRASVGLGRVLSPLTRVEVGYMLRSREEPGGWQNDHIGFVYLLVDAPR